MAFDVACTIGVWYVVDVDVPSMRISFPISDLALSWFLLLFRFSFKLVLITLEGDGRMMFCTADELALLTLLFGLLV